MTEKIAELTKEENKGTAAEPAASAVEKTLIKLTKPYQFEGAEHKEIDITEIESLTSDDLVDAEAIFNSTGGFAMMPEISPMYTFIIASKATKLPLEFFRKLPIRDGLKVKNAVVGFLNS